MVTVTPHTAELYNCSVLRTAIAVLLLVGVAFSQTQPSPAPTNPAQTNSVQTPPQTNTQPKNAETPQVKINYLNVCTPSADEQHVLDNALSMLPSKPPFGTEFEVARGRSTMPEEGPGAVQASANSGPPPVSTWVRIRREFASGPLMNVQYTFSHDEKTMTETLVFRIKSPKRDQPMQVSIQDALTAPNATQAIAANTSPDRVRVERFGGSSVVLARCPQADQTKYERYFARAKDVMTAYRHLLGVKETVPGDLARVK